MFSASSCLKFHQFSSISIRKIFTSEFKFPVTQPLRYCSSVQCSLNRGKHGNLSDFFYSPPASFAFKSLRNPISDSFNLACTSRRKNHFVHHMFRFLNCIGKPLMHIHKKFTLTRVGNEKRFGQCKKVF